MEPPKWITSISAWGRLDSIIVKQTGTGGLITLLFGILAIILAIHETKSYLNMQPTGSMEIDVVNSDGTTVLRIDTLDADITLDLDMTLPRLPCAMLNFMHLEATGEDPIRSVGHKLYKQRLSKAGKPLGIEPERLWQKETSRDTLPADDIILQDMSMEFAALSSELESKEGCRVYGIVTAPRVSSVLYLSTSLHSDLVMFRLEEAIAQSDMSHKINRFRFGRAVPGLGAQALEGVEETAKVPGSYSYYMQIVPTKYHSAIGLAKEGFQYSVQQYFAPTTSHYRTPSIMFEYEFYPVTVVVERGGGGGLLHFVVRLCAVIGGCVGLARATDYVAHLAQEAFDKWLAD